MDTQEARARFDADDPATYLPVIEQCLLTDPKVDNARPWTGWLWMAGFEQGHRASQLALYDGVVVRSGAVSMDNPVHELAQRYRDLTVDPDRGPFRHWLIIHNGQTGTFEHRFLWPGEDDGWDVLGNDVSPDLVAAANPVDATLLDVPFSAVAVHALHARHQRRVGRHGPRVKRDAYSSDRLPGGWRLYVRTDARRDAGPLQDMADAVDSQVFLVADSQQVTLTDAPLDQHAQLLADLNAG